MKKLKKTSIIKTIIIAFFIFSIIWVCFIMGRIEHGKPEKDEFNISYKEKDEVIDDGCVFCQHCTPIKKAMKKYSSTL